LGFQDRVAIVTGGASGLGKAMVTRFIEEGCRVAIPDLNGAAAEATAAEIEAQSPGRAVGLRVDVTNADDVKAMVKTVIDKWGRIDILINNAGICPVMPFEDLTVDMWDKVMIVNLRSMFLCTQAVAPIMIQAGYGKIVNIASFAGQAGGIVAPVNYAASKGGAISFTRSLARIYSRKGINVNAVAPGTIKTPMTDVFPPEGIQRILDTIPIGRLGLPEEVADGVVYLCSDRASYITGQVLSINGGSYMG
jgi:NAD(P)-dependent dehydrogenase (short-subunit alcohol dehydrogenase family)